MTPRILESIFTWHSLINTTMPPRDPNDNDDEEEKEDEDDEDEEDENREPAVIRGNRGRGRINETCIPFSVEAHH